MRFILCDRIWSDSHPANDNRFRFIPDGKWPVQNNQRNGYPGYFKGYIIDSYQNGNDPRYYSKNLPGMSSMSTTGGLSDMPSHKTDGRSVI